jgi:hypothetical protein
MAKKDASSRPGQPEQYKERAASSEQQESHDEVQAKKTKDLVMKTSALVFAVLIAAYFELISHKFALWIIVAMYAVLRFFT